jgi:hypothetical protein
MFKVGQKVVCIDGYSSIGAGWTLMTNEIYEVKSINTCKCGSISISVGFYGYGTHCNDCKFEYSDYECFHRITRFRPLDETFAEEVLSNIKEQIKEEELILV